MPTLVILATADSALADTWEYQLPPGRSALRLSPQAFPGGTSPGFAAVVVLDAAAEPDLPGSLVRCPTIFVGEPRSAPFEQARLAGRAKVYLTYEESQTRLREYLPLVEEVAEKQSMLDMLVEKVVRRGDSSSVRRPSATTPDSAELWDFLEGAVENLDSRERLLAEFRRAARHVLHASHAVFFLREPDGFRADRGTSSFKADDAIVDFFERHPIVVDGNTWDGAGDPVAELAVRNRLALWGARLLVPVHDNARLLGLIALGVRDDGQPYDEVGRTRAVFFARLLRHFLAKAAQVTRLTHIADETSLGAKYLPSTLVLGPDESAPRQVPVVIRDLIGQARRTREAQRIAPREGQPFRGAAGIVAETGGVWAFWDEASAEVHDAYLQRRAGRRELLRELGLTLSHEVGNGLVSLVALKQASPDHPVPPLLLDAARGDVAKLEQLNRNLTIMQTLDEIVAAPVDVRELAQAIGNSLGVRVDVGPDAVTLALAKPQMDFALRSLISTVAENRPDFGMREMKLVVRSTGSGAETTALLSLKGKHLELEGILPEPEPGAVPNQGRLGVFLAKEILRLHHGEIHAGPGLEGTEILISFRSL